MSVIADRMAGLGTENAFKVGEDIARAEKRGVDVVRFTLGEPDFASPPHVNQIGVDNILAGNTHYVDPAGIAPFRKAVADHVSRDSWALDRPGTGGRFAGGQAWDRLLGDDIRRPRRRSDLPEPRVSDLRVMG